MLKQQAEAELAALTQRLEKVQREAEAREQKQAMELKAAVAKERAAKQEAAATTEGSARTWRVGDCDCGLAAWGERREAQSSQPSLRSLARRACAAGMRGRGQCAAGGPVYSIPIRIVRQPPASPRIPHSLPAAGRFAPGVPLLAGRSAGVPGVLPGVPGVLQGVVPGRSAPGVPFCALKCN